MKELPAKGGEEMDTFSVWRYRLGMNIRPGKTHAVKNRYRRRVRQMEREKDWLEEY